MKQTRCAIYARVSGNGQNPEMQIKELQTYCRKRGWQIAGEYVDRISGTKDSRPELNRLMADAHRRVFRFLVVWKFDRFARSVSLSAWVGATSRDLGIGPRRFQQGEWRGSSSQLVCSTYACSRNAGDHPLCRPSTTADW